MVALAPYFDSKALLKTLTQCAKVSVLVVGDLMLDEYVTGNVERISPEAPVPIVHAGSTEFRLGGAGNVARQVAALGARVQLVATIGNDAAGDTVQRLCEEAGISAQSILTVTGRRTTRKLRVVSQSQQLLRIDWEERQSLTEANTQALLQKANSFDSPDAIILSDYAKGVLSEPMMAGISKWHGSRSRAIVVDPKHRDFSYYRGARLLTPNLRELGHAVGRTLDPTDMEAIASAARSQIQLGEFEGLIVTLGDQGMLVILGGGEELHIPAIKRAVYDVTGAGDTVAAVLTTCLAAGGRVEQAAYIANVAAGIAVGEIGAVAVAPSSIADALTGQSQSKIYSRVRLQQQVGLWRHTGKRIVLTNGCFDLLHPGHLSLLSFAKSLGDCLVLAINSDAAVRRLKGPTRPVVSQLDRAAMLSALACVDAVTIFDEDTPIDVIRSVQPEILVKGQDYRLDDVVGRDFVESTGGRVVLAPLLGDYSTTSLLARAQA
jgi:D-beta-D-heptose 7-phosphate kinase / D-beta-D-heptose 1-phosphate adenosyltransferase